MRSTLPVLLTTFATARRLTSTSMRPASSASNAATISEPSGSRAMVVWSRPGCFELGLPPKLAYRVWSSASGNSTAWDSASMALSAKISRRSSVWIVDIGFDDSSIDAELTSRGDLLFQRDLHYPLMQLFDDLGAQLTRQPAHSLVIGHFAAADPSELAINQIGADFTRQIFKAPVAKMF